MKPLPKIALLALCGVMVGLVLILSTKNPHAPGLPRGVASSSPDDPFGTMKESEVELRDDVSHPVAAAPGVLSWDTLAKIEVAPVKNASEGTIKPLFSKEIEALNHKTVTIKGFMFPLEQGKEAQSHFLLSAYPPSCPFCLPGGPAELVEVTDSSAIPFTYAAITLRGEFQLLEKPEEYQSGMFYRMVKAEAAR